MEFVSIEHIPDNVSLMNSPSLRHQRMFCGHSLRDTKSVKKKSIKIFH